VSREPRVDQLLAQKGWGGIENIERRIQENREVGDDERIKLAQIADSLFSSGDGALLLDHLLDKTLRRPMIPVALPGQMPVTMDQVTPFVVFREGQNAIVQGLLDMMRQARAQR
jgi:hypothetical protein